MKRRTMKTSVLSLGFACITMTGMFSSCTKNDSSTPTPVGDPSTVTDVDGNVYKIVRIGTQLWTTENLRTTRYNDSTAINTGLSNGDWGSATTGAYSIYEGDGSNNTTYGKLYNWHAVNTGKLAPKGWHIASRAEWETLVENQGGSSVAGGKLKSTSALWIAPNTGATNSSGFSGLPSGYRGTSGSYELKGETAYWWASSARNATQGDYLRLDNDLAGSAINGATKTFGYTVRCVKD